MGKSGMVAVKELSNIHIENIIDLLKKELSLPENYRAALIKYLNQTKNFLYYNKFSNLETLSIVMLDYDFDGEFFDLDKVFYAEDLKKNDYEVCFTENKVKGQMMAIYIDIFGNDKREIKTLKDFRAK